MSTPERLPTQAEIDASPHAGLGNIPSDYAAGPTEMTLMSPVSMTTTRAAILRAAHILRHEGHGGYDVQQADILDALLLKEKM